MFVWGLEDCSVITVFKLFLGWDFLALFFLNELSVCVLLAVSIFWFRLLWLSCRAGTIEIELTTFCLAGLGLLLAGGLLYLRMISASACSSKWPDFEVAFWGYDLRELVVIPLGPMLFAAFLD